MTTQDLFAPRRPSAPPLPPTQAPQEKYDGLTLTREDIMLDLPRGRDETEVLRLRFVMAKTATGKDIAWHDLRLFYQDHLGAWKPGKGVTIRGSELRAVRDALIRATT